MDKISRLPFRNLTSRERAALARARGEVWRGALSLDEFERRNERLYAHSFGRDRMRSWGLCAEDRVPASLDALAIHLLVSDGKGKVEPVGASHLASVLTLPSDRGKGLATRLLTQYFEKDERQWTTLFSGIDPRFYERFGFQAFQTWEHTAVASPALFSASDHSVDEFVSAQRQIRRQTLLSHPEPTVAFCPDAEWWDWYAEIYQFFAETRGRRIARGHYWSFQTSGGPLWVAGLENALDDTLDVVWVSRPDDPQTPPFLAALAHRLGLRAAKWVSSTPPSQSSSKPRIAMVRSPLQPSLRLLDVQLGDWW